MRKLSSGGHEKPVPPDVSFRAPQSGVLLRYLHAQVLPPNEHINMIWLPTTGDWVGTTLVETVRAVFFWLKALEIVRSQNSAKSRELGWTQRRDGLRRLLLARSA